MLPDNSKPATAPASPATSSSIRSSSSDTIINIADTDPAQLANSSVAGQEEKKHHEGLEANSGPAGASDTVSSATKRKEVPTALQRKESPRKKMKEESAVLTQLDSVVKVLGSTSDTRQALMLRELEIRQREVSVSGYYILLLL